MAVQQTFPRQLAGQRLHRQHRVLHVRGPRDAEAGLHPVLGQPLPLPRPGQEVRGRQRQDQVLRPPLRRRRGPGGGEGGRRRPGHAHLAEQQGLPEGVRLQPVGGVHAQPPGQQGRGDLHEGRRRRGQHCQGRQGGGRAHHELAGHGRPPGARHEGQAGRGQLRAGSEPSEDQGHLRGDPEGGPPAGRHQDVPGGCAGGGGGRQAGGLGPPSKGKSDNKLNGIGIFLKSCRAIKMHGLRWQIVFGRWFVVFVFFYMNDFFYIVLFSANGESIVSVKCSKYTFRTNTFFIEFASVQRNSEHIGISI